MIMLFEFEPKLSKNHGMKNTTYFTLKIYYRRMAKSAFNRLSVNYLFCRNNITA